ncbi:MAG: hypothetical protein FK733_04275 [Asgard group archaeon]|nr:hypothetical protein [Asgard group archaeon]
MANRTAHVTVGFILGAIYIPIDILIINNGFSLTLLRDTWLFWVIGLYLAILGSESPDLDHLLPFMSHRDIVTHSAFFPAILFSGGMWWKYRIIKDASLAVLNASITVIIPYLLAYGSHLFLDFFPNINIKDLANGEIRVKEKKGAFLMHLPFYVKDKKGKERKTLNVKGTEWWLIINSWLIGAMAALLAVAGYFISP